MEFNRKEELQYLFKRVITKNSIELLKIKSQNIEQSNIKTANADANFLKMIWLLCDECFPKKEVKLKPKLKYRSWITQDVKKSSKKSEL